MVYASGRGGAGDESWELGAGINDTHWLALAGLGHWTHWTHWTDWGTAMFLRVSEHHSRSIHIGRTSGSSE